MDALDKNGRNTRRNVFLSAKRVLAAGPGGAPQPLAPTPRAQLVRAALGKMRSHAPLSSHKGRRGKKMIKVTYIFCSPKKEEVTYFILFLFLSSFFIAFFWVFRNKSSSKTRKKLFSKKSIWAHHKKMWLFSPPFLFSPSVVLLDFFYRVFGCFVTRGF
jgi:hypothetical protein